MNRAIHTLGIGAGGMTMMPSRLASKEQRQKHTQSLSRKCLPYLLCRSTSSQKLRTLRISNPNSAESIWRPRLRLDKSCMRHPRETGRRQINISRFGKITVHTSFQYPFMPVPFQSLVTWNSRWLCSSNRLAPVVTSRSALILSGMKSLKKLGIFQKLSAGRQQRGRHLLLALRVSLATPWIHRL